LFSWWSVRWSASLFLALKNVTDPSDLTKLWMMQESLDYFYRSISISIMPGILRNLSGDQKEEKVINILIKKL